MQNIEIQVFPAGIPAGELVQTPCAYVRSNWHIAGLPTVRPNELDMSVQVSVVATGRNGLINKKHVHRSYCSLLTWNCFLSNKTLRRRTGLIVGRCFCEVLELCTSDAIDSRLRERFLIRGGLVGDLVPIPKVAIRKRCNSVEYALIRVVVNKNGNAGTDID